MISHPEKIIAEIDLSPNLIVYFINYLFYIVFL